MRLLFYPGNPIWRSQHGNSLSKTIIYCQKSDIEPVIDIKQNWDLAIHWNYEDKNKVAKELIETKKPIINQKCTNITKSKVEQIFKRIFGYSSLFEFKKGYCLEKGEKQSAHDGKIVKLSKEKKSDCIYQKIIDTRVNETTIRDIILPIFFDKFPYGWFNYRPIADNFGRLSVNNLNTLGYYEFFETKEYFTENEIEKIRQFCKQIGLDTGEINIVRSIYDNKIYIIDVNNLPGSRMFKKIPDPEININKLASVFKLGFYEFINQ